MIYQKHSNEYGVTYKCSFCGEERFVRDDDAFGVTGLGDHLPRATETDVAACLIRTKALDRKFLLA